MNGRDIFNLPREEVDFDPSRTENLEVQLKVNDAKAIDGNMPYIVEDVNEKIDSALTERLVRSIDISRLTGKSWVCNEFLDLLLKREFPEQGLDKLRLSYFNNRSEPFEDEVLSRLALICPRLQHLELSFMS